MTAAENALAVARAYHESWTSGRFEDAAGLLAPELKVEVPINQYPTRESFAEALASFGAMATRVTLLSELGQTDEAKALSDERSSSPLSLPARGSGSTPSRPA